MSGATIAPFFGEIINHLWQSTAFALAAALLALACRRNRARVRYWLWLSASLKFLVPFALLISFGSTFREALAARRITPEFAASVSQTMMRIARPFPDALFPPTTPHPISWLPSAIFAVWAGGFGTIALMRLRGWLRLRAAVRASAPIDAGLSVEVRSSTCRFEPGVVGFFRPTLLLPQGILQTLTPAQLDAILAHELSHIRRRDNLTAALHMFVEALFWFYPLIWWIGARLVQERERACDEAVLSRGTKPGDYAEAILNVCKLYVESPLICVSGVTGLRLNRRIRAILTRSLPGELPNGRKTALLMMGIAAAAAPIVLGMMNAPLTHAQSSLLAVGAAPVQFTGPSARAAKTDHAPTYLSALGVVTATTVTVTARLDGQLIAVNFKEGSLVRKGQLLASIDGKRYRLQLAAAQAQLVRDQGQLDAAGATQGSTVAELGAVVQTDRARVEAAQRQLSYADIIAPITGIAGFRLVDIGNLVHSGDPLVVINQLQPIAVRFSINEDYLPKVLARLEAGANPTVAVSDRNDDRRRIATAPLVAVDNQIDTATGTVTLKAMFENQDGALFPGQFVNVSLLFDPP